MEKFSLLVPMLNTSKKYQNSVPIEFQYDNNSGLLNCIKSIEGINTSLFKDIYIGVLDIHNQKYNIVDKIKVALANSKLKDLECHIKLFTAPTSSQAETIYSLIDSFNISGPIFIKDADNMCIYNGDIQGNTVLVYQLENTPIVDPQHKSYVSIDDQNFIINIIEKRVVSNLFNCGGYGFKSANDFKEAFNAILEFEDITSHMYISHIIYWLILNKKIKFRPVEAIYYEDFEIKQK